MNPLDLHASHHFNYPRRTPVMRMRESITNSVRRRVVAARADPGLETAKARAAGNTMQFTPRMINVH